MSLLSAIVVAGFGIFLIGLTVVIFASPALAEHFFMSFASSARAHYVEQVLRLLIGASLVVLSPGMWQSDLFHLIGWLVVISSIGLIVIPWRWHRSFGKRVLPTLVRHMRLYAIGLFAFGAILLYGAFYAVSGGAT